MRQDPKYLEQIINYQFKDKAKLIKALTHRSYNDNNNERLEFLGDALLDLIIGEALFYKLPKSTEGELTRIRASLVKKEALVEKANHFQINKYILLGAGELKSGGLQRGSILADCIEAVIAAIYLDSDFITCKQVVSAWYNDCLSSMDDASFHKDAKTILQEWLQARRYELPDYTVIDEQGTPHNKQFTVKCYIERLNIETKAIGQSIRKAEQEAAKIAMDFIQSDK